MNLDSSVYISLAFIVTFLVIVFLGVRDQKENPNKEYGITIFACLATFCAFIAGGLSFQGNPLALRRVTQNKLYYALSVTEVKGRYWVVAQGLDGKTSVFQTDKQAEKGTFSVRKNEKGKAEI